MPTRLSATRRCVNVQSLLDPCVLASVVKQLQTLDITVKSLSELIFYSVEIVAGDTPKPTLEESLEILRSAGLATVQLDPAANAQLRKKLVDEGELIDQVARLSTLQRLQEETHTGVPSSPAPSLSMEEQALLILSKKKEQE